MPMTKTRSKTSSRGAPKRGRTSRPKGNARSRSRTRASTASRTRGRTSNRSTSNAAIRSFQDMQVNDQQVEELVLQALETELGGVQVYETALRCVQNDDLREEWEEYHEQTQRHVEIVQELCQELGIDAEKQTPGREVVRHIGESLGQAMEKALESGPSTAAELVAAECVTLAETKDHQNWALIGQLCEALDQDDDERCEAFEAAYDEVEDEEDEHLYHTAGWARELWIESLGLPAVLPPPEEEKDVKSMAQAARAIGQRKGMARKKR
jgi:rubrerythrin